MDPCDNNTDKILDAISGNLPEEERLILQTHLAGCDRCSREWEATLAVWEAMAFVERPVPSPAPEPVPAPVAPTAGWPPARFPGWAIAASLVIGLFGGYLAGRVAPNPGTPPAGAERAYLLLLRQSGPSLGPDVPPETQLVQEYGAWAGELAARNALLGAERLDDFDLRYLTASGTSDETVRSRAPHISGFFLVEASTLDEAVEMARQSPHVRYGGSIEVRAIARD